MKKAIISFVVITSLFMFCVPVLAVDKPPDISTPINKPVVSHNGNISLFYITYYNPDTTPQYQTTVVKVTGGTNLKYYENTWLKSDTEFTIENNTYDTITWDLIATRTETSYYNKYKLYYQAMVQGGQFAHYKELPNNIINEVDNKQVENFVTWGVKPVTVTQVMSSLSEPIYDPHNYYLVLTGDKKNILIWLNIYSLKYQILSENYPQTEVESDNFFEVLTDGSQVVPQINISSSTLTLSLEDIQDYEYSIKPTISSIVYGVNVSVYELETGKFISSSNYSGTSYTNNISLGSLLNENYGAIRSYGIYCTIDPNLHLNLASVLWGHDVLFSEWKQKQEQQLNNILQAIEGNSEQETYPKNESASEAFGQYEQAESELMSDYGQQADEVFSMGMSGLQGSGYRSAFNLIRTIFEDTLETHSVLPTVILFSLALGIAVLILGRKIG